MDKKIDPVLALELKLSSWNNLMRVLKWAGFGKLSPGQYRVHEDQEGSVYTEGNAWAAVQSLQQQLELHREVQRLATENFGPLSKGHPLVGSKCPLCGRPFVAGQVTAPLEIGPAGEEDARKKRDGRPYTAACDVVHRDCLVQKRVGVRFIQEGGDDGGIK